MQRTTKDTLTDPFSCFTPHQKIHSLVSFFFIPCCKKKNKKMQYCFISVSAIVAKCLHSRIHSKLISCCCCTLLIQWDMTASSQLQKGEITGVICFPSTRKNPRALIRRHKEDCPQGSPSLGTPSDWEHADTPLPNYSIREVVFWKTVRLNHHSSHPNSPGSMHTWENTS